MSSPKLLEFEQPSLNKLSLGLVRLMMYKMIKLLEISLIKSHSRLACLMNKYEHILKLIKFSLAHSASL